MVENKKKKRRKYVKVLWRGNAQKSARHSWPEDRNRLEVLSLSSDALVSLVQGWRSVATGLIVWGPSPSTKLKTK
jgi:hypothetical protein